MMNTEYILGFVLGSLIAVAILLILWRTNRESFKGQYDERQELIRGRGYRYAFFAVLILLGIYIALDSVFTRFPVSGSICSFTAIITGVVVYAIYCLRNGAFFGISNNSRGYKWLLVFVVAVNLLACIMHGVAGEFFEDGVLTLGPSIQALTTIAFAVILIAIIVQGRRDETEAENEES